eukprot:scaffold3554_cov61-Phaeocystis_antarctica.AAC.5
MRSAQLPRLIPLRRGAARVSTFPGPSLALLDGDGDELALQAHLALLPLRPQPHAGGAADARHDQVAADHRPLAVVVGLARVWRLQLAHLEEVRQAHAAALLLGGGRRRAQRPEPRRLVRILLPLARRPVDGRLGGVAALVRLVDGNAHAGRGRAPGARAARGGEALPCGGDRAGNRDRAGDRAVRDRAVRGHGHRPALRAARAGRHELRHSPHELEVGEVEQLGVGPAHHDVLERVQVHVALAIQVVARDAVDVDEHRLLVEGRQAERRILDPQLCTPAHAHGAAVDGDAVRELGVIHRHAPRKAQQALPARAVQFDGLVKEREVLRLDEEQRIVGAQRVYQRAEVELELRRCAVAALLPLHCILARHRRAGVEDLSRCC